MCRYVMCLIRLVLWLRLLSGKEQTFRRLGKTVSASEVAVTTASTFLRGVELQWLHSKLKHEPRDSNIGETYRAPEFMLHGQVCNTQNSLPIYVSTINTNRLLLFRQLISVYSEHHWKRAYEMHNLLKSKQDVEMTEMLQYFNICNDGIFRTQ
jgi:hypothetical protein